MSLLVFLTLSRVAAADDAGASVAPGPAEVVGAMDELRARLERADATERALRRAQNALAEALATGDLDCSNTGGVAELSLVLGVAHRDRAQAVRIQGERADRVAQAPTAAPVAGGVLAGQLAELQARAERQVLDYEQLRAWDQRFAEPVRRRCGAGLDVGPGFSGLQGRAQALPLAVVVLPGLLCPLGQVVEQPTVVLLDEPRGCWAAEECGACDPTHLQPAAVLGPQPLQSGSTQ